VLGVLFVLLSLPGPPVAARTYFAPGPPAPAYIHEFPHPPAIVQFHPRKHQAFTIAQLEEALRGGVHGVELDLRWRAADSSVVCSHERRGLADRPRLEEALEAVARFQGSATTVRGDGLQFFLFLDLKEESSELHRGLLRTLAARADRFANSARPRTGPRGTTVVLTGFRAALERSLPPVALDTLCVIEGRDYGKRLHDVSHLVRESSRGGRAIYGTFQWAALDYPVERSRVRDIHSGQDPRFRGRFNVRVIGARGHVARALDSGADAVNADLDEIAAAVRHARALAARRR
jgi:hypothetical protein